MLGIVFFYEKVLSHVLIPRYQNGTTAKDGKMYEEKCSLLNDATRLRSCSGRMRGCVPRIGIWPPRRDEHPGVPIGLEGTRRSDWPERV